MGTGGDVVQWLLRSQEPRLAGQSWAGACHWRFRTGPLPDAAGKDGIAPSAPRRAAQRYCLLVELSHARVTWLSQEKD